jgi:hypothetical protein
MSALLAAGASARCGPDLVTARPPDARYAPGASGVDGGLPFGPFHLPDDQFRAPFTGALRGVHPEDVVATLDAARRSHFRVVITLQRGRKRFRNPDGSFSLALWQGEIDRFRGIDFAPYVADGTLLGHYLFDEPHDPTNWDGRPVAYAVIDSAAAYSKRLWPTMPTIVRSPPTFLAAGAPWRFLDVAWAQYTARHGDVRSFIGRESAAARRMDLGLAVSLEVLSGGPFRRPISASDLRDWGSVLASEPTACGLFMWKYDKKDPSYFERADVRAAAASVARVASARAAPPCRRPSQTAQSSRADGRGTDPLSGRP